MCILCDFFNNIFSKIFFHNVQRYKEKLPRIYHPEKARETKNKTNTLVFVNLELL